MEFSLNMICKTWTMHRILYLIHYNSGGRLLTKNFNWLKMTEKDWKFSGRSGIMWKFQIPWIRTIEFIVSSQIHGNEIQKMDHCVWLDGFMWVFLNIFSLGFAIKQWNWLFGEASHRIWNLEFSQNPAAGWNIWKSMNISVWGGTNLHCLNTIYTLPVTIQEYHKIWRWKLKRVRWQRIKFTIKHSFFDLPEKFAGLRHYVKLQIERQILPKEILINANEFVPL